MSKLHFSYNNTKKGCPVTVSNNMHSPANDIYYKGG